MSRLLIVDDDPNTLASLARAFRMAGHEAEVADNAGTRAGADSRAALRPDLFRCCHARQGRHRAARGDPRPGRSDSGGDDFRPGDARYGGTGNAAGRCRFSRKAAFHRQASADGGERDAADAPGSGKSRAAQARRAARDRVGQRRHAPRDGAGGARRGRRIARLHPGRNGNRERTHRARRCTRTARGGTAPSSR